MKYVLQRWPRTSCSKKESIECVSIKAHNTSWDMHLTEQGRAAKKIRIHVAIYLPLSISQGEEVGEVEKRGLKKITKITL